MNTYECLGLYTREWSMCSRNCTLASLFLCMCFKSRAEVLSPCMHYCALFIWLQADPEKSITIATRDTHTLKRNIRLAWLRLVLTSSQHSYGCVLASLLKTRQQHRFCQSPGMDKGDWGRTHHHLQALETSIACTSPSVLQDKVIRCCASGHLLQLYLPCAKTSTGVLLSPAWEQNLPLSTAHCWCNDPWHVVMWTHTPVTSWSNCRFISWSFDLTVRSEVASHSDSDKDAFLSCFPLHQHSLQVMAYCLCLFIHQSICQVMTQFSLLFIL